MLSPLTEKLLLRYPVPTVLVEDMRVNPPIVIVDPATITGNWTLQEIEGTIHENLTIMSTSTVLFWKFMRSAQHTLALYINICHPSNVCTDTQLVNAIVALTYQLVTNLMTAGPRMRVEEGEEEDTYIIVIDPERYDPADEESVTNDESNTELK